jgi:hypothetical protein
MKGKILVLVLAVLMTAGLSAAQTAASTADPAESTAGAAVSL